MMSFLIRLMMRWPGVVLALLGALAPALQNAHAAIAYGASGNAATGTTSLSVPYPSGIAAGNLLVMVVGNKYPTNGPATPSGWTKVVQGSGGNGSAGADSGQVYATIFVKEATGSETGNLTVTLTSSNTSMARMFRYSKAAGTFWDYAGTTGTDSIADKNWAITGAANPGIRINDLVLVGSALNGNAVSSWTETLSASGVTVGTTTERNDSTSGTGDDMGLIISEHPITAGTATAAPTYSMTGASGSAKTNSPTGTSALLRMREVSPPTVAKAFSPSSVASGGTSVLTITLTNPNAYAITAVAFTDTYPSGLVNATTPSGSTTCSGGTVTAASGGGSVALGGATIAASSSCTVTVNVTAASSGSYANTISALSFNTGNGNTANASVSASATLAVLGAPTAAMSFSPVTTTINGTSILTITLSNANTTAITGAAFTDTYPSGLVNTSTPAGSTTCSGGTVTAAANGGSLALSGATIPASGSCTVTVNVTSAAAAAYLNSTGTITTTNAGSGTAASATLTVTTAALCFSDDFNRASLGSDWNVGYKTGTFGSPVISGNRLRLTNTSTGAATWATLVRTFPAAGNMITVVFDQLAYGGTHGDGMAVVLSDASIGAQAGAFGGSLGYAQKSNPGSDCTTTGGCPGFSGGWLGIAIDEYGNYSTNTEGRYNGGASLVPNSVAVRGSGTGMSGYRFLTGTSTLSPGVDSTSALATPHRYRVIVDHRDGTHVYASVERSTDGGTTYTTLIPAFDVKDPGYSQNPIPTNFTLSFTGSTGGSTNTHEIDNLSVCTELGQVTPSLHHIKIEHGGTACTSSPASITIKACADAACTSLYAGSVTASLSAVGTWSPTSPITFTGGQTTVTLTGTAGAKTLGTTSVTPTATNTTECYNGTTQTCTLTFNTCVFDVIETGAAASTPIYTKLAGTAFNLDVLSLSGSSQTPTTVELVNASSGTCSTFPSLQVSSTANAAIAAGGRKTYSFTYSNAASNVRARVTTAGPVYSCSSDNFAIRPQSFSLTSSALYSAGTDTPKLKAGSDFFSITATATAANAYNNAPKVNGSLVTSGQTYAGTLSTFLFPTATAGVSQAGNPPTDGFTYSEVGTFNLGQYAVYDDTFTAVDSVKGECTSDFSNTLSNSRYGCMFGSAAAGPFGRFTPHHFDTTVTPACTGFTYSGQAFAATVTAKNYFSTTTKNYSGSSAKTVTLSDANGAAGSFTPATVANTSFTDGVASPNLAFTYTTKATAPSTLKLRAVDTDTVSSANGAPTEGTTALRSGRLRLENAYGSELLPIRVPVRAEYFNGTNWMLNTLDSCTTIAAGTVAVGNGTPSGNAPAPTATLPVSLASGAATLVLSQSGTKRIGSVDVAVNLGGSGTGGKDASCIPWGTQPASSSTAEAWLQYPWCAGKLDPAARLRFGSSKAPYIYLRERY